jgi:tetratricopeptide (TPR) repeat protein
MKRFAVISVLLLCLSIGASAHCVSSFVICFSGFFDDQSESPAGRSEPMAKSQEELDAFLAAASQGDLSTSEQAAADFVSKFPDSELRASAYAQLMQRYQQSGRNEKAVEMGRKALSYDPGHTIALTVTATALADSTNDTSPDKEARLSEALKDADAALESLQSNRFTGPQMPPDESQKLKQTLVSSAYSAKGVVYKTKKQYAEAEKAFKSAVDAYRPDDDPAALLHLAIVQDLLGRPSDALVNAAAAIKAAEAQKKPELETAARKQHARLKILLANAKSKGKKR